MRKTQVKEIFRMITRTKAFCVTLVIVTALAVMCYSGISFATKSLTDSCDQYFSDHKFFDIQFGSVYGYSESALEQIQANEYVDEIQTEYYTQELVSIEQNDYVAEFYSSECELNQPQLVNGRLPQTDGECAVEQALLDRFGLEVGDTITLSAESDMLNRTEYRIVGSVNLVTVFATNDFYNRGTSELGDGQVTTKIMVTDSAFTEDAIRQLCYITLVKNYSVRGSDDYFDYVQRVTDMLLPIVKQGGAEEYERLHSDYQGQIDDAQEEFDKGQQDIDDADIAIADARAQLTDADTELAEKKQELADGKQSLEEARATLDRYQEMLSDARGQLDTAKTQLDTAKEQLDYYDGVLASSKETLDSGKETLSSARTQLDAAKDQLSSAETELNEAWTQLDQYGQLLDAADKAISGAQNSAAINAIKNVIGTISGGTQTDSQLLQQFNSLKAAYAEKQAEYNTANETYQSNLALYNAKEAEYEQGYAQYISGLEQYESGMAQLEEKRALYNAAYDEYQQGEEEYAQAKKLLDAYEKEYEEKLAEYNEGKSKISDAEQELDDYYAELKEKEGELADGKAELADAAQELADAKEQLKNMPLSQSFATNINSNASYYYYTQATNGMDTVVTSICALLMAIAVLVCFTTVSRMVTEQHRIIGTQLAMGFRASEIYLKYMGYVSFCTLAGVVLGNAAAYFFLEELVYRIVYGSAYIMQDFTPIIIWPSAIAVGVIEMAIMCLSAFAACHSMLKKNVIALLNSNIRESKNLEKTGKMHLPVRYRMVARNLITNPQILLTTLVSVMGCTVLLIAVLTVRQAMSGVAPRQFDELQHYQGTLTLNSEAEEADLEEMEDFLNQADSVELLQVQEKFVSFECPDGSTKYATLIGIKPGEDTGAFLEILDAQTQEEMDVPEEGVLICKKLAESYGYSVGDPFLLLDSYGETHESYVAGIFDRNIGLAIIASPDYYAQLMDTDADIYQYYVKGSEENIEAFCEEAQTYKAYCSYADAKYYEAEMEFKVDCVNKIILVMLVVTAVLTLFVLFNLAQMNIRKKEKDIVVMKVLGFPPSRIKSYVFWEAMIMSTVGLILGVLVGGPLGSYVTRTIEMESLQYIRGISVKACLLGAAFNLALFTVTNLLSLVGVSRIKMTGSAREA